MGFITAFIGLGPPGPTLVTSGRTVLQGGILLQGGVQRVVLLQVGVQWGHCITRWCTEGYTVTRWCTERCTVTSGCTVGCTVKRGCTEGGCTVLQGGAQFCLRNYILAHLTKFLFCFIFEATDVFNGHAVPPIHPAEYLPDTHKQNDSYDHRTIISGSRLLFRW